MTHKMRLSLIALLVFGLVGQGLAQPAETAPVETAPPPAEPIMSLIPEDAIGFVVINNVQTMAGNLDEYIAQIGLSDLVSTAMPGGSLAVLQAGLMLGPGFNPDGGLAAVMLDPEKFGMNLATLLGMGDPGSEPVTAPATPPAIPLVIFIPGSSVEDLLGMYGPQPGDPYTVVMMPMGLMHASTKGGYVVLSPSPEALTAVLQAEATPADAFGGDAKVLNKSDLAVYMKMESVMPLVMAKFDQLSQQMQMMSQMGHSEAPPTELMDFYLDFYKDLIKQMDSFAMGLRWVPTGLLIEESVTFRPESMFGQMVGLLTAGETKLVGSLPNLPYIMALGQEYSAMNRAQLVDLSMSWLDVWSELMMGTFYKSEEDAQKWREISKVFYEQVYGVQFVIGGAPENSGAFGMSYVLKCKDAGIVHGMIEEMTAMTMNMIYGLEGGPQPEEFKLVYTPGAEMVGEVPVDVIEIVVPELFEELADDQEMAQFVRIIGEDKLRIFVAKADAETVVITFGGSTPYVAEALKAATEGGSIPADPKVQEVLQYMPDNPFMVVLFNVGNLFSVINKAVERAGEGPLLFNITSKTPIAIGGSTSGNTLYLGLFAPNELVREAVGLAKSFFMPPPPQSFEQPGTEEF